MAKTFRDLFLLLLLVGTHPSCSSQVEEDAIDDSDEGSYDYEDYSSSGVGVGDAEGLSTSGDYNYSYDYYREGDEEEPVAENELHFVPEMLSQPLSLKASSGDRVEMPCSAKNSDPFVRIWMRGDSVLFTGDVRITRDSRFSLSQGDTLVLERAVPDDSGSYTCRIMLQDEINLSHTLDVLAGFAVVPVPADGLVRAKVGESAVLGCQATGEPVRDEFKWRREGYKFSANGEYTYEGKEYVLDNTTREDAGFYFCTGTSEKGDSRTASLRLQVNYPPKIVNLEKSTLKSGRGLQLELACTISSEPEPKVTWYKGDEVVSLDDRVSSAQAGTRHLLLFGRVRNDDVGRYMCYATNDLGSAQMTLEVTSEELQSQKIDLEQKRSNEIATTEEVKAMQEGYMMERKEMRLFRESVLKDMEAFRNLTLTSGKASAEEGQDSGSTAFDLSLFADLERVQLELGRLRETYQADVSQLLEFRRSTADDLQSVWDNVNELQEVANVTTRNVEDIYDKDILKLQDFRTETENAVKKLRSDLDDLLSKGVEGAEGVGGPADGPGGAGSEQQQMENLDGELKRLRGRLELADNADKILRNDLQGVFEDIDGLKTSGREVGQEQEMLKRKILRLEEQDMADIVDQLSRHERHFEEFGDFRTATEETMERVSGYDDEKFNLVVKELQRLKSQIYYMQQGLLQMKTAIFASSDSTNHSTSSNNTFANQNRLSKELVGLRKQIESNRNTCLKMDVFKEHLQESSYSHGQLAARILANSDRVDTVEELANSTQVGITDANAKLARLALALDRIESEARKYNLILKGLPPAQKLERPFHLDQLVRDFFRNNLGLVDDDEVSFDEAIRLKVKENAGSIRIRFPNVREKVRVLGKARKLLRRPLSLTEDFTERVKNRRKRLAGFARRRARVTKKKWALKYDELYFNGRVFVFNEELNRVVQKRMLER